MKERTKRLFLLPVTLLVLAGAVTGCNTLKGMGEDVETAGEEMDEEV